MSSSEEHTPRTFYQFTHPFEERCRLSAQLRKRYRNHIPIIFEPEEQCQHLPNNIITALHDVESTSNRNKYVNKHLHNSVGENDSRNNHTNSSINKNPNNKKNKYSTYHDQKEQDQESFSLPLCTEKAEVKCKSMSNCTYTMSNKNDNDNNYNIDNADCDNSPTYNHSSNSTSRCTNSVSSSNNNIIITDNSYISSSTNNVSNLLGPLPFVWAQTKWPRMQSYITNLQRFASMNGDSNINVEGTSDSNNINNNNNNNNKKKSNSDMENDKTECKKGRQGSHRYNQHHCVVNSSTISNSNNSGSNSVNKDDIQNTAAREHHTTGTFLESTHYTPSLLPRNANSFPLRASHQIVIKFVMPARKTLSEVILTLRERLALHPHQAVFLTVGSSDVLAPGNALLGELYVREKDPDGFLYIAYALENTFGSRSSCVLN